MKGPFEGYSAVVKPEWIDFNGHFNAGYYLVCFDDAVESWMDFVGLGRAHRDLHAVTTFSAQNHVTYLREVHEGAPILRQRVFDGAQGETAVRVGLRRRDRETVGLQAQG